MKNADLSEKYEKVGDIMKKTKRGYKNGSRPIQVIGWILKNAQREYINIRTFMKKKDGIHKKIQKKSFQKCVGENRRKRWAEKCWNRCSY